MIKTLYRTRMSVVDACRLLGVEFEDIELEDLEQCSSCGIWWYSYELTPDLDDNNICKFCETRYGR